MYGPFGNLFPYSDQHTLNLDWIIKVAKNFLDQYTHIQDIITTGEQSIDTKTSDGLQQLQTKANELEAALNAWYTEHSQDIQNTLATALTTAITNFQSAALSYTEQVIASIPEDYTALSAEVVELVSEVKQIQQDILYPIGLPQNVTGWSQGQLNPANGGSLSSSTHCRTSTFTFSNSGPYIVTPADGYMILLLEYNGVPSSDTFIGIVINYASTSVIVNIDASHSFRWCIRKVIETDLAPSDLPSNAIVYQYSKTMSDEFNKLEEDISQADLRMDEMEGDITTVSTGMASVSGIPNMLVPMVANPCYDHLFVNRTGAQIVIPHESIYHVNISRSLGYKVIEANVQKTLDGYYFVNHLDNGTFGSYFYSLDDTDISEIRADSVNWSWILENVRYRSSIPKYRTAPTSLEEFLIGCKQNQLIPIMKFIDNNVKQLTEKIMGKNNYIVYEGTRSNAGDAVIFRWESYSTLADIINFCDSIGKPLIYGTSKFTTTFTEAQTREIVDELHKRGYMVCMSYEANSFWNKYRTMGIDFCGGTRTANRLITGNAYNLENIFNCDDFTLTNGTASDNVITLTENGTITCANIPNTNKQVAHVDLEVDFDGTLTLVDGLGEFRGDIDFSSTDGKLIVCTAVINSPVNFTLRAKGGSCTITNIKYKVDIC